MFRYWWTCILLFVLVCNIPVHSQSATGNVDWIFVLDTSASMHGAGGSANIFGKVQEAISEFIRRAHDGDTVTLYTFDRDTTLRSHIRISGELDKRELLKTISDLSSSGDRTYTGKALKDALERSVELKNRSDAANRTVSIVLFTDGLEDVRGIPNPVSIPSNIFLIPKDQPYIFYVSVGAVVEKQLESFVTDPAMGNRGEVMRDPGAQRIAELGETIRKKIEEPPKPVALNVAPRILDFKQIAPGEGTSKQELNVSCDSDCSLSVNLDSAGTESLSLIEPTGVVTVKAGESHPVQVRLKAAPEMTNGLRAFALSITASPANQSNHISKTVNVAASVNVVRTPLWRTFLKYLLLLLIALGVALTIISAIKGEPPWIWLPSLLESASLEGELQIIHPRPTRVEDEFISLTQLRTRRVSLRSLIKNGATTDSDAELEAANENGKPCVNLRRTSGTVYVNKIEVANTKIYNDDTIELGDTKLLFNWVNHDRPADHEESSAV